MKYEDWLEIVDVRPGLQQFASLFMRDMSKEYGVDLGGIFVLEDYSLDINGCVPLDDVFRILNVVEGEYLPLKRLVARLADITVPKLEVRTSRNQSEVEFARPFDQIVLGTLPGFDMNGPSGLFEGMDENEWFNLLKKDSVKIKRRWETFMLEILDNAIWETQEYLEELLSEESFVASKGEAK